MTTPEQAATDTPAGFTWANGLALGLMLVVDVLYLVGRQTKGAPFGEHHAWVGTLYAAGLTIAVAVIRPGEAWRDRPGRLLLPLVVQAAVYALYWGRFVVFGIPGRSDSVYVWLIAAPAWLLFLVGFVIPLNLWPRARRVWPLLLVELTPWFVLGAITLRALLE